MGHFKNYQKIENVKKSAKNTDKLSHINQKGQASMVDVSTKSDCVRKAIAVGKIYLQPETIKKIIANEIKKGEVLSTARIAGIIAAKKTAELIPLCHPLMLTNVGIEFIICENPAKLKKPSPTLPFIQCIAEVSCVGNTGVEMEALTAVNVALLTIYDMAKAIDRFMVISEITLKEKVGGASGHWQNPHLP